MSVDFPKRMTDDPIEYAAAKHGCGDHGGCQEHGTKPHSETSEFPIASNKAESQLPVDVTLGAD